MTITPSTSTTDLEWVKSSHSTSQGPECVEVAWTKSSYSTSDGPVCVEVASADGAVYVRDSKDKEGPKLAFSPTEWSAFVTFAADMGVKTS